MPESDSLLLQCSYVYPQTGKKCLNEIKNEMINYCSLHLVLKCDNKNVDIYNQQNNLEEKTNYLIKRIKRLQNKQLYKHVNIQLSAFVKYQQEQMNVSCLHPFIIHQELLNKNLVLSSLNSQPGISQEDKLKLFSHENIKTLPTSQLVKLVKKLEQNNLNIKQNNVQNQQSFLNHHNSINSNKLPNDQQPNLVNQPQNKNELLNNLNNIKKENISSPQQQVSLQPNISKVDNQNLTVNKDEFNKNRKLSNNKFGSNIIVNRKSVAPKFTSDQIKQINNTVGIIKNNLKHLEYSYDSDATESSSGGESCDEFDDYLNDLCKQQKIDYSSMSTVPLSQKANWKWALERGAIASRWTWLQAQVSDLDFKIRQQNEMYKQFRSNKGPISFYSNESNQPINGEPQSCVRTLPLKQMKKRKLVRSVYALSTANRKIARYSTVLCSCNSLPSLANSCVLCNDRYSYVQMIDTDCMPLSERIALLDASYHSVLSLRENISLGLHFSKLLKKETVQRPMIKTNNYKKKKICQKNINTSELSFKFKNELKSKKKSQAFIQSTKLKKKYEGNNKKHQLLNKKARNVRLKSKVKDRFDNSNYSDESSRHDSPLPSPFTNENGSFISSSASSLHRRRRSEQNAFDINNIVIPYSIASTTRVEKLQYKEIITPKWRVTENEKKELEKLKELNSLEEIEKMDVDKNGSFKEKDISSNNLSENNSLNNIADSKQSLNNNSINNNSINDEDSNSSELTDVSDKNKSDSLEDLSDEIFIERHLKCEADEKKRFCTYLKNPIGNGSRGRGIRQRTESSKSESINLESNTIDNSSQDSFSNLPINLNINSTSKAISPGPDFIFEESSNQSTSKQRTFSLSRRDDFFEEENHIEKVPYEKRNFPLSEIEYNELTMYLDE